MTVEDRVRALEPGCAYLGTGGTSYLCTPSGDLIDAEGRRWKAASVHGARRMDVQRPRVVWDEWAGVIVRELRRGAEGRGREAGDCRDALAAIEGSEEDRGDD